MEIDNYIIEDTETDTIQTQEGLAGAYQYQESANTSEQSGSVSGDDNELDQYSIW